MDKTNIFKKLAGIYLQYIDQTEFTQELTEETPMDQLPINSVDFIKIIIDIENEFGFEFDDENLLPQNYVKIGDMVDFVFGTSQKEST